MNVYLYNLTELFMDFLEHKFYGEPVSTWLISLGIVIGTFVIGRLLLWLNRNVLRKWAERTATSWDNIVLDIFETPLIVGINLFGIWLALERLDFSSQADKVVNNAYRLLTVLNATWFFARLTKTVIHELVNKSTERKDRKIDYHIVFTLQKILVVIVWVIGGVLALNNVGVNVKALVAGLGIGGVAFALAAQDTLKNILGGITIFIDRPFRIGERIKVDGYDGYVEDIGIRSVRLRTLDNRLVTMPNSSIVSGAIENVTQETSTRVVSVLGLTYDTSPEAMQLALRLLKDIPNAVADIKPETTAAFTAYNSSSMDITFIYYIKKRSLYHDTISAVNLQILNRFKDNQLSFAFPTRTLYVSKIEN